ncbi:MAG: ribosome silencing factor [Deltaproteobacteria bacterium]|nr:ribosome silencing factor [Deltaproteobacteria bacterium]
MLTQKLARLIIAAAQDTKAEDIHLYDMENRSPLADYVVICSGRSQAHVRGICDKIEEQLKQDHHMAPQVVEGYQEGSWVLMDFTDVIVHVFHPETRRYYDLESLLADYRLEIIPPPESPNAAPHDAAAHEGTRTA